MTIENSKYVSEHLANERTFLAWLRTSFSLLTLGFATNKFGQFLIELRIKSDRELPHGVLVGSRRFGLGMVMLGTLLIAVWTCNYQQTRRQIERGTFTASVLLLWFVGVLAVFFGLSAIILLLET